MKKIHSIYGYMLVGVMALFGSACSNDETDALVQSVEKEKPGSSRVELVEATVALTADKGLEAALKEILSDPTSVQKLIISGDFYAADILFLQTLPNVQVLDMSGVTIKNSSTEDGNGYWYGVSDNEIPNSMFMDWKSLTNLTFPDNLVAIRGGACYGCSSLTSIVIPDKVEVIDWDVFWGCTSLTSAIIPASVTSLGGSIFRGAEELKSVELWANVESIPGSMFENCSKLETVKLSSSITTIEGNAFYNCTSLKDYTPFLGIKHLTSWSTFAYCGFTEVDLSNVETLGGNMFYGCSSLTTVKLSDALKVIPNGTFSDCTALSTINMPSALENIENEAFYRCSSLNKVELPNTVKTIGNTAFYNCVALETLKLSSALESIGGNAFADCTSLNNVVLPASLKSIGYDAFRSTSIKEIIIPASVTTIESGAFSNTMLSTLTVPETVTSVGGLIVNDCKNLVAIFWNSLAEVHDRGGLNSNCYLYITSINGQSAAFGPNWKNIIIDGVAENIELSSNRNYYGDPIPFYVPQAFTAKKISYKRSFNNWQETQMGQSTNWQTIVLPFTPTSFTHAEKGVLAPFDSNVEGAKPFWLRELKSEGFVDVTTMQPGVPYIISMPYNPNLYLEEYNIRGEVVFSAENVELAATSEPLSSVSGPAFDLVPTYEKVAKSGTVYVLNTEYWIEDHPYGSVFARSIDDVYPFEAYAVSKVGSKAVIDINAAAKSRALVEKNTSGIPRITDM